jgi:hypothetical protein
MIRYFTCGLVIGVFTGTNMLLSTSPFICMALAIMSTGVAMIAGAILQGRVNEA